MTKILSFGKDRNTSLISSVDRHFVDLTRKKGGILRRSVSLISAQPREGLRLSRGVNHIYHRVVHPETDSLYVEGDIDGITLSVTSCANTSNVENHRWRSTEVIAMLAAGNVIRISGG